MPSVVISFSRRFFSLLLLLLLGGNLLAGCSNTAATRKALPVFFPPPPNEPRVQFLVSFNSSKIIEAEKSWLEKFISGTDQPDRLLNIQKPYSVVDYQGIVYVTDTATNTIFRIDLNRKTFAPLRGNGGQGQMKKPTWLAVDENGRLYVVDTKRKEILVFTADGDFVQSLGKDLVKKPSAIAVDHDHIYWVDIEEANIKVLDRNSGTLIRSFDTGGQDGDLAGPIGITLDDKGVLYVTNMDGHVIKIDRDGHVLLNFGRLGDRFGEFARPKGISVDAQGRIFVVDSGLQNVQIFNDEGRLLMYFGNPGLPAGSLNVPTSIWLSKNNLEYFSKFTDHSFQLEELIYVANQFGHDAVSVYGLGHLKEGGKQPVTSPQGNAPVSIPPGKAVPIPSSKSSAGTGSSNAAVGGDLLETRKP